MPIVELLFAFIGKANISKVFQIYNFIYGIFLMDPEISSG